MKFLVKSFLASLTINYIIFIIVYIVLYGNDEGRFSNTWYVKLSKLLGEIYSFPFRLYSTGSKGFWLDIFGNIVVLSFIITIFLFGVKFSKKQKRDNLR